MIKLLKILGMPFILLFGNIKATNSTSSKKVAKPNTTTTGSKKNIWNTIIIVIAIMVFIFLAINLIKFGASAYSYVKELFTEEKTQSTVSEKSEMTYYFSNFKNGRITKNLNRDDKFYPIGGNVKLQTPSGKFLIDTLGVMKVYPETGDYSFWADSPLTTGIRIVSN